jgi:hypothetical protein
MLAGLGALEGWVNASGVCGFAKKVCAVGLQGA